MATADYALSDSDSGSDAEFDVEYGGISENTLKFIGVDPSKYAIPSTSNIADQPHKVDEVIQMLVNNSKNQNLIDQGEEDVSLSSHPKSRRSRNRSRLPKELQGLMGEANLMFARGEYEEVMVMCKEIIKSAPTAPEPYQTLSVLHEDMGDMDNAFQFGLVGAHLDVRNTEEWIRLAEMAMEAGNMKDCANCYRQVAKHDRENTQVLLHCSKLEVQLGDLKKATEVLQWVLDSNAANTDSNLYTSVTKELAKLQRERGKLDKGIKVLEKAIELHPEFVTSEEINMLGEFYIEENKFSCVLELLTSHCGVVLSKDSSSIKVPAELAVDLRSKLAISLAHKSLVEPVKTVLASFQDESVEEVGDLFIDMSEALQLNGMYVLATELLEKLIQVDTYSQAAVWLKYSECLSALGRIEDAAKAYGRVVEMAPNHVSARVQLSLLQQQLGLEQEALHTLAEGGVPASSVRNDWTGLEGKEPRLLLHTCLLLHSQSKLDEFFKYVQYLLFGQLPPHIIVEHEAALMACRPYKGRITYLRRILPDYDEVYKTPPALVSGENSLTENECWDLFNKACETAHQHKRYDTLFSIVKSGYCTHAFFSKKQWSDELDFKCMCSHVLLQHGGAAFDLIRDSVMKIADAGLGDRVNQVANIFSMITSITPRDMRFARFSERQLRKYPNSAVLSIAHGCGSIIYTSYRAAINQFMNAYRQLEDSPILNLLIGVCFLHIVCMKFTSQRATLAAQGVCFLNKYLKLRGECQESFYNIGRAMQQLSINSAAVYYYKKCLETQPCLDGDDFDLRKDAAFNLSLIYKASGSEELASHIIQTHCVI